MRDEADGEVEDAEIRCAECDRPLPAERTVCPHCSPPSELSFQEAVDVEQLLRRARGQLILGSLLFPWLFAPLALQNTLRAKAALKRSGKRDSALSSSILRIQVAASLATAFVFGFVVLWLARAQ